MKSLNINIKPFRLLGIMLFAAVALQFTNASASSHREAPLIANDPVADNTDLYAFRSPNDTNTITIIANYIPFELPHGGPNYYSFGENVRYEIHIDNNIATTGDDIIYRVTFTKTNEDPTTFFNIRLGKQNLKTTYTLQKSINGGATFTTIISNGVVPPNNIGARSIENATVGLGTVYDSLMRRAITTASTGERVFCGPVDDPFFVDLGGIFDLGDAPRQSTGSPRDGVAGMNVHTIAIQIPISMLQKGGLKVTSAKNILDPDFVIGVWASASRMQIRTLETTGTESTSGNWVQVSRIGMPLTNEAVIPIGKKDMWNSRTPHNEDTANNNFFYNPELALYMDDSKFGGAVPAFADLRIQRNSLQSFDFGNGEDGLYGLKGNSALKGTALDDAVFGTLLLPGPGKPRSVDLWPIFHTGVPNLAPYQLATGKSGNPLANGKPFINNFLPNGGDMLRLNMAVPVTPRNSADFSTLGLVQAAALGLTDSRFNTSTSIQNIPNMDGFPNGRRLEDDVTRIELQAVGGVVLAAIGLWYDDYDPKTSTSPLTQDLLNVLGYTTGVEANDTSFNTTFPFVQAPWRGTSDVSGPSTNYTQPTVLAPTTIRCDGGRIATTNGDTALNICVNSTNGFVKFTNTTETSAKYRYVITNDAGIISTVTFQDSLRLNALGNGNFRVYGLSYVDSVLSQPGTDIDDINSNSCFQLSDNFITIVRDSVNAGTIRFANNTSATDTVCLGSTSFTNFGTTGGSIAAPRAYIVTDASNNIISVSMSDSISFSNAAGTKRVYIVSYIRNLNASLGNNISTVTASGCADVSNNFVTIVSDSVRTTSLSTMAGAITDTACIENAGNITFKNSGTAGNTSFAYVITDETGNIISFSNNASTDFSTGAAGNRRVYGISYIGRLNATVGNNISTVSSARCFKVSNNFVTIIRGNTNAGTITTMAGRSTDTFCVNKPGSMFMRFKTTSTVSSPFVYVLTDAGNNILAISTGDSISFAGINKGTQTRIYGVSYLGSLNAVIGNNISTISAERCTDITSAFVNVTVDSCTIISVRNTDFGLNDNISLYPNPAGRNLNIVTDIKFSRITIVNSLGQTLHEDNNPVTAGTKTIDVAELKPGMYFISFYTGNTKAVKLFIKE